MGFLSEALTDTNQEAQLKGSASQHLAPLVPLPGYCSGTSGQEAPAEQPEQPSGERLGQG